MALNRSRTAVTAFGVLLICSLVGCTAPAPAPSPSPSPAFASDEDAYAAAEARYREYVAANNAVDISDPKANEFLTKFATGRYRSGEVEALSEFAAKDAKRTGEMKVVWFRGEDTDRDRFVEAIVCKDVSGVQIVDGDGNSLVSPDRPALSATKITFLLAGSTPVIEDSEWIEDTECVSE